VRVPYTLPAPKVAAASSQPVPLSGSFTWRDEFDSGAAQLAPLWLMLRTPKETWWNLNAPKGALSLTPRADTLDGLGNPAFFGRRVQHAKFDASTLLAAPAVDGVAAGLALFQSETHFYFFGVRRTAEGLTVFVELANGDKPECVAQAVIPAVEQIELRIKGEELGGGFSFRDAGGEWRALVSDADLTPITTNAAGGGIHFTGAVVGPYARLER
jgi:alpha-N-arabinofuranosidase